MTTVKLKGFGLDKSHVPKRPKSSYVARDTFVKKKVIKDMIAAMPLQAKQQLANFHRNGGYSFYSRDYEKTVTDSTAKDLSDVTEHMFRQLQNIRRQIEERNDYWSMSIGDRNREDIRAALRHRQLEFPSHGEFVPHLAVYLKGDIEKGIKDDWSDVIDDFNSRYSHHHWKVEVPITYARKPQLKHIPLQWLTRNGNKFLCLVTDVYNGRMEDDIAIYDCTFYAYNKNNALSNQPKQGCVMMYLKSNNFFLVGFGETVKKARSLLNRRLKAETMEALADAW